jgi:hypothetical protein
MKKKTKIREELKTENHVKIGSSWKLFCNSEWIWKYL